LAARSWRGTDRATSINGSEKAGLAPAFLFRLIALLPVAAMRKMAGNKPLMVRTPD
jgi:hypothetical protein